MSKLKMILRSWEISDKDDLAYYANNKKIADNLRNAFPHPYSVGNAEFYIKMCKNGASSKEYLQAIDIEGRAVGSIGLFLKEDVNCKCAELGYWLGEEFWRKGIMSEAIKQICNIGFMKYDLVRIFAEPFADNIGSRKVLEKSGFVLEGIMRNSIYKNEIITDSCMYALLKENSV